MLFQPRFPALLRNACAGAMLVALCAQPAFAGGAKTTDVDLRIGVTFTETIGPSTSISCLGLIGEISGTGYSTDLGAVGIQATDCVVPTDASFSSFSFVTQPDTVVILTTQSGGQIHATYSGMAKGFPIASISATLKIAGGTGRYKNAIGSATIEGVENIGVMPAVGVLVISGKLSY